jgi:hypothetical protein
MIGCSPQSLEIQMEDSRRIVDLGMDSNPEYTDSIIDISVGADQDIGSSTGCTTDECNTDCLNNCDDPEVPPNPCIPENELIYPNGDANISECFDGIYTVDESQSVERAESTEIESDPLSSSINLCTYYDRLKEWCTDLDGDCFLVCNDEVSLPVGWEDCDDQRNTIGGEMNGTCMQEEFVPEHICTDSSCLFSLNELDYEESERSNFNAEESEIVLLTSCQSNQDDQTILLVSKASVDHQFWLHHVRFSNQNHSETLFSFPINPSITPTWIGCTDRSIYLADQIQNQIYTKQPRSSRLSILYPLEGDRIEPDDQISALYLDSNQEELFWLVHHLNQEISIVYRELEATIVQFPIIESLQNWVIGQNGWTWITSNYALLIPTENVNDEDKEWINLVGNLDMPVSHLKGSSTIMTWSEGIDQLNVLPWGGINLEPNQNTFNFQIPVLSFSLTPLQILTIHAVDHQWIWIESNQGHVFFEYTTQKLRFLNQPTSENVPFPRSSLDPHRADLNHGWFIWSDSTQPNQIYRQKL